MNLDQNQINLLTLKKADYIIKPFIISLTYLCFHKKKNIYWCTANMNNYIITK